MIRMWCLKVTPLATNLHCPLELCHLRQAICHLFQYARLMFTSEELLPILDQTRLDHAPSPHPRLNGKSLILMPVSLTASMALSLAQAASLVYHDDAIGISYEGKSVHNTHPRFLKLEDLRNCCDIDVGNAIAADSNLLHQHQEVYRSLLSPLLSSWKSIARAWSLLS